jgi:hypothetical protein
VINRLTAEDVAPEAARGVVRPDAEPEQVDEHELPAEPNILDILRSNDEHLRAIHRSTARSPEWDRILKDWLLLYGWADAARKREARRNWGDTWDYVWAAAAGIGSLLAIYLLLYGAIWISQLLGGGEQNFWASIVVAVLIGAPIGLVSEWIRRKSNK